MSNKRKQPASDDEGNNSSIDEDIGVDADQVNEVISVDADQVNEVISVDADQVNEDIGVDADQVKMDIVVDADQVKEDADAHQVNEDVDVDADQVKVDLIKGMKSSSREKKEVTEFSEKIFDVLKKVEEVKGEFALSGQLEGAPLVPINIQGYGTITLPLYRERIVTPLLKFFKKSHYGLKEKTILDESVRKSWELKKTEFTITNPAWDAYMKAKVIPEIAKGMMLEYNEIEAQLYKLLLYEPGSFFKPHRDSEKEDGMFGSLIVQLPSKYTGGELIIRHNGQEKIVDFENVKSKKKGREFPMYFCAFYCDLEHEVKPLIEGYRVSLVYNLISKGGQKIRAPTSDTESHKETFSQLLNDWKYLSPKKLIYVLSHKYTLDGLSLDGLKGSDQSLGQFMKAVSDKTGLCVALGILETQEFGTVDYTDLTGHLICQYYEGSSTAMLERLNFPLEKGNYAVGIYVKNLITLEKVEISPNFKPRPQDSRGKVIGGYSWPLSVTDDEMMVDFNNEVLAGDSFKGILADWVDYTGSTGNEGLEMKRWYNKSVLVFWPQKHSYEEIWTPTGQPPREIIQESDGNSASTSNSKKSARVERKRVERSGSLSGDEC